MSLDFNSFEPFKSEFSYMCISIFDVTIFTQAYV